MNTFLMPEGLFAMGTAVAGIVIFGLAPYLPSLFPPAFTRFIGFGACCSALVPLWVLSDGWLLPAGVGACCLLIIGIIHWRQTRRRATVADEREP